MEWTKKAPTEPGYYWLKTKWEDGTDQYILIREFIIHYDNPNPWLGAVGTHTTPKEYKKLGYEFLGPITPEHTLIFKGN